VALGADLATKADLDTKPDLAALRGELKAEIAALLGEIGQVELRLEAKIESMISRYSEPGLRPDPGCARRQHRCDHRCRAGGGKALRTLIDRQDIG
jgi:hypothetical protein